MLVVGLGNPGVKYENTRHNAGFRVVDTIAEHLGGVVWKSKFKGAYGEPIVGGIKVRLLKPATYMNASGEAVVAARSGLKLGLEEILVVHDELDLPFGELRMKAHGGHGGHNGLRSIVELTGGHTFPRLRFGIGHPGKGADVVAYVLGRFTAEQDGELAQHLQRAADAAVAFVRTGMEAAVLTLQGNKNN